MAADATPRTDSPPAVTNAFLEPNPDRAGLGDLSPTFCDECATCQLYAGRQATNIRIFRPLNDPWSQIRLLRLDPRSRPDKIVASLQTWSKDATPKFKAISYVCGNALPECVVHINGHAYYVGQNCFDALSQVCRHHPGSHVWVDAICVNQQDLAEKSAQVAIMGTIYAASARVLACIGPSDEASDDVLSAADDLDAFLEDMRLDGFDPVTGDDPCGYMHLFCEVFEEFADRPYFTRAWIVQELSIGGDRTHILCGKDQTKWSALVSLAAALNNISRDHNARRYRGYYNNIWKLRELRNCEFPDYLRHMERLGCQDPRDRFYSTLTLVDWHSLGQTPPTPDYRITPLQLAFDLMDRLIYTPLHAVSELAAVFELTNQPGLLLEIGSRYASQDGKRSDHPTEWSTTIHGINVVHQDEDGRLQVNLQCVGENLLVDDGVPCHFDQSVCSDDLLRRKGLTKVYTGDHASVLATSRIRAGDIIAIAFEGVFVLRPCYQHLDFSIVGAALLAGKYKSGYTEYPPTSCECWKDLAARYNFFKRFVLGFEASNEVVLAAAIATPENSGTIDLDRGFLYLERYAIGTILAESGKRVVPTSQTNDNHTSHDASPRCTQRKPCADCNHTDNPCWDDTCLRDYYFVSVA